MQSPIVKNQKHTISTAYIRLMLAAEPSLAEQLNQKFSVLSSNALNHDHIEGAILEELLPMMESLGVDSLALRFGKQIQLSSHGPLGFAALSAPDLRSALQTMVDYNGIRTSLVQTQLVEAPTTITVINHVYSSNPLIRRWLSEVSTDVTRAIIETVMGHDISAQTRIAFSHSKPKYAEKLDAKYGTICEYSKALNFIAIPASWGDVKSPLSDESSYLDNVAKCRNILVSMNSQENSASLVEHHLNQYFTKRFASYLEQKRLSTETYPTDVSPAPTLPEIASKIAVSGRTLARRLEARGSSYKSLLRSTRNELATRWLSTTHLSVTEIAYLLGYQEAANFTRAFKSWHQCSPQQWRKLSAIDRTI
jgi:AraC-like DNA-binding protein